MLIPHTACPGLSTPRRCPGESQREGHRPAQPTTEPQPPEAEGSKARVQQVSLSSEAKEAFETAPCRVHLAAVMQELKASLYLSGEDLFIPNCDTRGFYRRKQCRASKGPKRGQCWCVDKKGHPLAGMEGAEGVPHCLPPSGD
ncbi:insulin-like growth factor-binding protein 6 [Alligator mississippiensis]|uniref:Insulin-like growth factor-binding protein 6 n=1 Tax=Alligator mississippiensis TaxID=8496 RepID=A0A151MW74_ALLMI|nr:insulin-like growth factor-binding protein 6 [Alligator mississippiensis]